MPHDMRRRDEQAVAQVDSGSRPTLRWCSMDVDRIDKKGVVGICGRQRAIANQKREDHAEKQNLAHRLAQHLSNNSDQPNYHDEGNFDSGHPAQVLKTQKAADFSGLFRVCRFSCPNR